MRYSLFFGETEYLERRAYMLKSDTILRDDIGTEITRVWHFNPYKIDYQGPSINRYSSEIDYECLNCNHVMHTSFSKLEDMWEKHGWYCPKCKASFNPVYQEHLPNELCETDPKLISDLDAEYSIMLGIEEHLGCQPYEFKNLNKGKSVRLQHKVCSSIFSATPSMLYNQFHLVDKYSGEDLATPYCPKCNWILEHDGVSYSGSRFLEALHNWFEELHIKFPYTFTEDAIYRFKDYEKPIVTTCVHCGHVFTARPSELFTTKGESLCPICGGTSRPFDSGDGSVSDVDRDNKESQINETVELESSEKPIVEPLESRDVTPTQEEDLFVGDADKPFSSPELVNIFDRSEIEILDKNKNPNEENITNETRSVGENSTAYEEDISIDTEIPDSNVDKCLEKEDTNGNPEEQNRICETRENGESSCEENPEPMTDDGMEIEDISFDTIMDTMYPETQVEQNSSESEDTNSNDENEELKMVETDVDDLVDSISREMKEDQSVELESSDITIPVESSSQIQFDSGGYPLEYTPKEVPIETPEFANPQIVDTPENRELMYEPEEKTETFEEMTESIGEIFEDLNIQKDDIVQEDISEELDDDDPNLGIPVSDDDDEDDSELTTSLIESLGEELPTKPDRDQIALPVHSISIQENPSPGPWEMNIDYKRQDILTQPEPQVDIIQENHSTNTGIDAADVNWTDVWGSL